VLLAPLSVKLFLQASGTRLQNLIPDQQRNIKKGVLLCLKQTPPPWRHRTHKIGKVTFRVSSFGNPNGTKSATEMLVQMMEHQLRESHSDKEEESA